MNFKHFVFGIALFSLAACGQQESATAPEAPAAAETATPTEAPAPAAEPTGLDAILAAQPEEVQARYQYRNPKETLEFFGIEPAMTVVEVLPGGGWYSKILLPHLGAEGELVGVNYATDMWQHFGGFANEEFLARIVNWTTDWTNGAEEWRDDSSASISAFVFGAVPEEKVGTADAVLFVRALHNMARFDQRPYLDEAIQNAHEVLKPGGIAGVVQHEAPADATDEWANGSAGYLKRSFVIERFEAAGFELVAQSDVNQNAKDNPTETDFVWRLPPSLRGSDDDSERKAAMQAIGESNRMTLKFKKAS